MRTNALLQRTARPLASLAGPRAFAAPAAAPAPAGHDFGAMRVTAAASGSGPIQCNPVADLVKQAFKSQALPHLLPVFSPRSDLITHPVPREDFARLAFQEDARQRLAFQEDARRRLAFQEEARRRLGIEIPTGPTMYADIRQKMLLPHPYKSGQYAEVDVPGHTPGAVYDSRTDWPLGSQEEFEASQRAAHIEQASGGHTSGFHTLTDTGTIVDLLQGTSMTITGQRQVFNPGRHSAALGSKDITGRLTTGAVTGDYPQKHAPPASSRFLSYQLENKAHDAAQDAFHTALRDGTLPLTSDGRFHNAYHVVTDMGGPVGEIVQGLGKKTQEMVTSVFGQSKAKVYSQTTGPASTQHVRTVFNVGPQGRITRAQHFPTLAGDAPKSHFGEVKTGSSTVFATTHGSHSAPTADLANMTFAWDKP